MELSNSDKNEHGLNNQNSVGAILNHCKQQGYIKEVKNKFYAGRKGYLNDKQFYAPFLIEFDDGTKWIIYTTTSLRDRIKAPQWDSFNLKSEFKEITTSLLVYPDSAPDDVKQQFISKNKKFRDKIEFSAIDAILDHNELYDYIEKHYLGTLNNGKAKSIQGIAFENRIANILSAPDNFKKWKYNRSTDVGTYYNTFKIIVECFGLRSTEIRKISATSDKKEIGSLPTKGSPKTDVLITVEYNNGTKRLFTISCKKTAAEGVSVHQYNADAFANVLDKNDINLRRLLKEFQRVGNLRDFGNENAEMLTNALKPLNDRLTRWVLGGIGGQGDPTKHWAQFLLTYKYNDITDDISIYSIDDYILKLKETNTKGHFGTFFKWTFASGHKGKDIQLKTKII